MIPQSFIQDLLARVDVVDVVARHVKLRKAGANFLGLCPFHAEKSPSFTVSPAKQFYHCFGCGAHGSAIGFLMEHAGLSYVDAIHELAQSVGLQVPDEPSAGREAPRADPGLLELMAAAAHFYRLRLRDSPRAIDYLKGRGLSGETAARYGIGYAPDGWRNLQAAVPDYGAPALVDAGLVIESGADEREAGDGPAGGGAKGGTKGGVKKRYDRFRDRIMFPIRNPRGQVIGFGGRVLGAGEPKYMNSPETPLFSKGRELYGLFEARDALRRENCAIVVEGYMDVVMLAQHGVSNAVATLGTATTPDHVRKLLRLVDRVVFSFDGDAAGRKAAWRALEACLPHAEDTKRLEFLFLPPEHDPDSYVRAHGVEGFSAQLRQALPLSEFMLQELATRADLAVPEGRAAFLALARPLILALPNAALRMQVLHSIAEQGGVAVGELDRFVNAGQEGQGRDARRREPDARPSPGQAAGPPQRRAPAAGFAPRPKSSPPDMVRRVRLLAALHPALAAESPDPRFLPRDVLAWLDLLRRQPAGSSLAVICESLRGSHPEMVEALLRDAAADRSMVADMNLEEARAEFEGALGQLRDRSIREELDAIVARGLADHEDRARYHELLLLRHKG
ncbi:CHC2 zinc finger domain-containing protein [Quisquiliibacterium transsilvanicum]|uniref:DNA primase n=1 Tax=Quisquiliibacterium transsilvanicum TaxID=1549638 RepID=A0A7W8M8V5_9BURK|nr:DNA primase [Quisquiliibacterium transsilvanicum]